MGLALEVSDADGADMGLQAARWMMLCAAMSYMRLLTRLSAPVNSSSCIDSLQPALQMQSSLGPSPDGTNILLHILTPSDWPSLVASHGMCSSWLRQNPIGLELLSMCGRLVQALPGQASMLLSWVLWPQPCSGSPCQAYLACHNTASRISLT